MAEVIAFNIIANLLIKLGTVGVREICLVYGVEDELEKLKDTLSTVEAALLDADKRKENSHLMQDWIRKLNNAIYDADDVLDAFATKALQHELKTDGSKVREFFSSSIQLAFRYKLGRSIKEMRERFDDIAANMSKFNFTERLIVQASVDNRDRETHSFVLASEITGRDKDKEEILKLLMCSSNKQENVSVIPIIGIGGLGKTTLTQLVYGDERVAKYFELKLWVCVSEGFEKLTLVKKMLKSLKLEPVTKKKVEKLDSLTKNEVEKLELDQLEVEKSELDQLQILLRQKLNGKKYLLILDDVWNENFEKWVPVKNLLAGGAKGSMIMVSTRSEIVASVMATENPYILKGLTKDQSWTLFEKLAFRGHEKVPPNLEVIGKELIEKCKGVPLAIRSLASVMQSKTQESEWLSIRNSDVWSLCQDDGDILPILKLSYDHLPIQLKQCFAYCSIFPKDHEIQKEVLIQLWMAQGYIQSSNSIQCLEDSGNQYFINLSSRSFFQDAKVNEYNEVISCKMHDLIHDLATRVAGSDCAIAKTHEDNISNRVHHVSIVYPFEELPRQMLKAKGLRTFLPTCDYSYQGSINRLLMSPNFICLRVLDVHSCGVDNVPNSIGKLRHLRYLDLSKNGKMTSLPNSIRKLINLQTLKLSDCNDLKRLPKGITKLINLRYLVTDGCWGLKYMPSGMGKLTSLRRLNRFIVGGGLQLSELNGLNELNGYISIEDLEYVKDGRSEAKGAKLIAKQYLHSLTLKWRFGYWRKGGSSENDGNMEEEILLEGLQPHPKLRELRIEGYWGQMFPSWMMTGNIVSSLPNIVRITLERGGRCRNLPTSFDQLPFLKFLKLEWIGEVEHINGDNRNNHRKSSTTKEGMSVFFPSLEELVIQRLPNLKGWWRAAETGEEGEREEWSQRPSFPRLTKLKIQWCPKFTSMPMIPPHVVDKLDLDGVPEKLVRQLLLLTTSATTTEAITQGSASSSFSYPLSKLKSLSISDIEDLESLPVEVFRNLASLETLKISSCPRLSSCFASEKEEEERFRGLTSLRSLSIHWCESLTSLSAGVTLHLTALQHLTIQCCDNFDFSGDHGVHWQGLRSLLRLTIANIRKLVSLPVGLQQLTTTLQRLDIVDCPGLMALPDWISNLTSLQWLQIRDCPVLRERCQKETGEDWPKISHIPTIKIDYIFIQMSLIEMEGISSNQRWIYHLSQYAAAKPHLPQSAEPCNFSFALEEL